MVEWIDWDNDVPVSLSEREDWARKLTDNLRGVKTPVRYQSHGVRFITSGDSIVLAWERSDGTIEIIDAKIRARAEISPDIDWVASGTADRRLEAACQPGAEERGLISRG